MKIKNFLFKGAVLEKIKKKLKFTTIQFNNIPSGYVLVKILYSSICRSQIMEIDGLRNNKKYLPHLLGHEAVGEIIAKHKKVKNFKIGDKVILGWIKNNKKKYPRQKLFNSKSKKIINSGYVTTFSNYNLVCEDRIVKKPKLMKDNEASFYGCAVPTGAGMVINQLKPKKNEKILLIGLGAVGICALAALKCLNIRNVCILETNKNRINICKKLGYRQIFNPKKNNDLKNLNKLYPKGFDSCIECAGHKSSIELGFSLINEKGKIIFASHPANNIKIQIGPHDLIIGKKIIGSWGGKSLPKKDILKIFTLFKKNNISLLSFFKSRYDFSQINNAIQDFKRGKSIRPLIKMDH